MRAKILKLLRLIAMIWLLVSAGLYVYANASPTSDYDGRLTSTMAYDSASRLSLAYDGASVLIESNRQGYSTSPCNLFGQFPELLAEETSAGTTFFHYTDNPNLAGQGLNINSGVTTVGNLNANEAMFNLGIDPPTYVYPVTLENPGDYLILDTGIPARNGIPAWQVIQQTPAGSVGLPTLVPPAP